MTKLRLAERFYPSDIMISFATYIYNKLDARGFRHCVFDNCSFNVEKSNVVCYTFSMVNNAYSFNSTIKYQIIGYKEF